MRKIFLCCIAVCLIFVTSGCHNTNMTTSESAISSTEPVTAEIVDTEESVPEDNQSTPVDDNVCYLDVQCIMQTQDLVNGCELVSLAILYNYYGIPVNKFDIADKYTPRTSNINTGFVGNPYNSTGMGCMPIVLQNITNNVLSEYSLANAFTSVCVNGSEFSELFSYIRSGVPVVFWATQGMYPHGKQICWQEGYYYNNEHCLVLTGYDIYDDIVYVSDPKVGNTIYPLQTVIERYNSVGKHAYILQRNEE